MPFAMKPDEYNVLDLIPQRPPMVIIDQLTYADEKSARGLLKIKESNLFCHNGKLQEAGLIEFIAQTAAACTGYLSLSRNQSVIRGFIGSVKNLVIHSLPEINTEIQSEIIVDTELLGYTIITGRVFQKDKMLAECEMRILLEGSK
jgi:predicted hotdog family 3-hydroxylacyl-ACP dehydratase